MIDSSPSPDGTTASDPTRLSRRLGTSDAVMIGLGAMIGAGVFAAIGPAAQAAGNGLPIGLLVAAFVAYCNATSSAQLAAVHPQSGGAYVYGRSRLGGLWGFLAGWGFVIGKMSSCAAMALTFGSYAWPEASRAMAVGAVVVLTAVNYAGVQKTALMTRAIIAVVLTSLAVVVSAALFGGEVETSRLWPMVGTDAYGILRSAGLLFFAFAGYARIATLGEEIIDPSRTIPRAIPLALFITLAVYALVALSALLVVDVSVLANAEAPLAAAVEAGGMAWLSPAVRIGATVASLGVLLSLIAGVSRTTFAMAANGDLPRFFSAVHPRYRVPHHAELGVGVIIATAVALSDIRSAIGFSSFAVLTYYAVTNASALRLEPSERRWPSWIAVAGLLGCGVLAFSLPLESVVGGSALLVSGAAVFLVKERMARRGAD